ncbi:hypothetical protein Tco_0309552 [Tanacetum coccineum]
MIGGIILLMVLLFALLFAFASEFVNEAALVKSVKVVAECLAVKLIFVIILMLSVMVNENLDRETMNTWTTKAPMISAIMSQLFNHTRYKKDLLLELLTVASHILLYGKIPEVESNKPNTAKFLHLKDREDNARG